MATSESLQAPRHYVLRRELDPAMDEGKETCGGDQQNVRHVRSSSPIHNNSNSSDVQMAQAPANHSCPHQGMVVYWKSKYEEAQREISALRVCVASYMQWLLLNNEYASARHRNESEWCTFEYWQC